MSGGIPFFPPRAPARSPARSPACLPAGAPRAQGPRWSKAATAALLLMAAQPAGAADQARIPVGHGTGAVIRALDMVTGKLTDLTLESGQTRRYRSLDIRLDDCRYPRDNPSADAFAHLVIRDTREGRILFQGWMVASSPALMAMDHPRYDVWVLRCTLAGAEPAAAGPGGSSGDSSGGGLGANERTGE